jgi:hypothetical protein
MLVDVLVKEYMPPSLLEMVPWLFPWNPPTVVDLTRDNF